MSEEIFPDYAPKTTPDTIYDYHRKSEGVLYKIFEELGVKRDNVIPTLELNNLKKALQYFKTFSQEAEKNPGSYIDGNILLGADAKEYHPSEEELIVSEIGKMIFTLLLTIPYENVQAYKKEQGIKDHTLRYYQIDFRHSDVMGSGRFFYADKLKEPVSIKIS